MANIPPTDDERAKRAQEEASERAFDAFVWRMVALGEWALAEQAEGRGPLAGKLPLHNDGEQEETRP